MCVSMTSVPTKSPQATIGFVILNPFWHVMSQRRTAAESMTLLLFLAHEQ